MTPAAATQQSPVESSGDVLRHQRLLVSGQALVDCSDSELVIISGPDRLVWLNSLITQRVDDLLPGQTRESLILDPQGKIEFAFLIADDGVSTWLLVEAPYGEALRNWLASMVFRMDVSLTHPGDLRIVGSSGSLPHSEVLMEFVDPWPRVSEGSTGYATEPHLGSYWKMRYSVLASTVQPSDFESLEGEALVPPVALDGLMIAAARPTMGEVDEKALPHELDWLRTAVHLDKGCYRGQETVAKVHNLGHPPRRLTLLHLDGSHSTLPRAGDVLTNGDKAVGLITRAGWHYELGPIALALLKRTTPVEAELEVACEGVVIAATQEVIVPPGAGATRGVPRLPRLSKR